MPIIQKVLAAYKLWLGHWAHFEKLFKYNIGAKIDALFLQTIENLFIASCTGPERKGVYLSKASDVLDVLKFMLQVSWEIKILDTKKYSALSERVNEVGRMLGGWRKNSNPAKRVAE